MKHGTKCAACGGTLVHRNTTHTQACGDQLYRFDQVPGLVCLQCGQTWLPAKVSQAIDRIIQAPPKPKKFVKVPVYCLS